MRLYVMRHGPAEDEASSGRDFDRALTKRGKIAVADAAGALASRGLVPTAIFSSPYVRARETAEIAASLFGLLVVERDELGVDVDPLRLVRELEAHFADGALLVGHNPRLSDLVTGLSGVDVRMGKAMIAILEREPPAYRLVELISPGHGLPRPRA